MWLKTWSSATGDSDTNLATTWHTGAGHTPPPAVAASPHTETLSKANGSQFSMFAAAWETNGTDYYFFPAKGSFVLTGENATLGKNLLFKVMTGYFRLSVFTVAVALKWIKFTRFLTGLGPSRTAADALRRTRDKADELRKI